MSWWSIRPRVRSGGAVCRAIAGGLLLALCVRVVPGAASDPPQSPGEPVSPRASEMPQPPDEPVPPSSPGNVVGPEDADTDQGVEPSGLPPEPEEPGRIVVKKGIPPREPASAGDRSWETGRALTFGRDVTVEATETVEGDIVVLRGNVLVEGRVTGDVVTFGGDVTAHGEVSGNIVALGGSIHLEPTTICGDDVVSVGGVIESNGAEIQGESVELGFFSGEGKPPFRAAFLALALASLVSFLVVLAVMGTAFAASAETMLAELAGRPRRCLGLGFAAAALAFLGAALLTITVIGVPFVLLGLLLACLFAQVGRILGAAWIGRKVVGREGAKLLGPALAGGLALHLGAALAGAFLFGSSSVRWLGVALLVVIWILDLLLVLAGVGAAAATRAGRRPGAWLGASPAAPSPIAG
jgi:hypothetical protein